MLSLGSLAFLLIQRSDALFESQEWLIDLRSLSLTIFVIALAVLGSLGSSKIDKQEFTTIFDPLFLNFDLSDSMTSTRSIISLGSMRCSHLISLVN